MSVSGTVYCQSYFQEQLPCPCNPISSDKLRHSSLLTGPGILSLVPIDYAFLPRLRGRLTLRRLALRRNPWSFGESVSHTLYRYSCQHSHFRYLQPVSRLTFTGLRNAPLPRIAAPIPSANGLSPVTFSAQDRLTSELLRFLEMMAASKPTSWLSKQSHIVSHLAVTWGP